jgi:hypothetical protein
MPKKKQANYEELSISETTIANVRYLKEEFQGLANHDKETLAGEFFPYLKK